jgi:hypothetical protein
VGGPEGKRRRGRWPDDGAGEKLRRLGARAVGEGARDLGRHAARTPRTGAARPWHARARGRAGRCGVTVCNFVSVQQCLTVIISKFCN